jgi:ubiquinone/menaquinone biosynthesis C-methylase UbiE
LPKVHHAAAQGFSTAAESYVQGRPDYPAETVAWLREVVGLGPGKTVLDLGAGTGKFIPFLKQTGARVVALEPVAAMRETLRRQHPEVDALDGAAEAIPLPDRSVDAIVCAQSFHWFATAPALAEMRRVLAPGGVLGLVWNVRGEHEPWVAALGDIIDPYEAWTPRYKTGAWRKAFPAEGFTPLEERRATHRHEGTAEQVIVQRTLSTSFIAALPQPEKDEVRRQVERLIASRPELTGRPQVAMPYEARMYAYRKTS